PRRRQSRPYLLTVHLANYGPQVTARIVVGAVVPSRLNHWSTEPIFSVVSAALVTSAPGLTPLGSNPVLPTAEHVVPSLANTRPAAVIRITAAVLLIGATIAKLAPDGSNAMLPARC